MAKKTSNRSRAARRGEIDDLEHDLKAIPRADNEEQLDGKTRVQAHIASLSARGTIPDTDNKISKPGRGKINNLSLLLSKDANKKQRKPKSLKERVNKQNRAHKNTDMLASKIEKSVNRYKLIQNMTRKKNWDNINEDIKKDLLTVTALGAQMLQPVTQGSEDESGDDWEEMKDEDDDVEEDSKESGDTTVKVSHNVFSVLESDTES